MDRPAHTSSAKKFGDDYERPYLWWLRAGLCHLLYLGGNHHQGQLWGIVVGPRAFPYIVGTVLGVTSIYFMIRPNEEPAWPILRDLAEIIFGAAVMLVYSWALPEFGFVISTIFATAYLTWRLGTPPLVSVAVGVATSIGLYVVFHLILGLALAKGALGF